MELGELEQSVENLGAVINDFPIGAVSLDDFKPVNEKIQATRESLMHLNARLLLLRAKYKQYTERTDDGSRRNEEDLSGVLQDIISDTLINSKAIKLCLHSTTILSILSKKEGTEEDQKKIYAYMRKLFTLNDSIMAVQNSIEAASQEQLDLKVECQKALLDHKNFLKEQERIQGERLQETNPEIVKNKNRMEKSLRKINVTKKLIRSFIAASGYMLTKEPLLEMLEANRELLNVEMIAKMSQSSENVLASTIERKRKTENS
ncbi:hypothetical protein X777_11181 [Ooceraea biroi]|uniref:Uncharacterized protein n=1 Tax=Ooceraea biroi TaxID=2015173 RepID=A0A026W2Q9_OOCBI|nr:hypothetical protein X777_11181 [Ooceraea biroi]